MNEAASVTPRQDEKSGKPSPSRLPARLDRVRNTAVLGGNNRQRRRRNGRNQESPSVKKHVADGSEDRAAHETEPLACVVPNRRGPAIQPINQVLSKAHERAGEHSTDRDLVLSVHHCILHSHAEDGEHKGDH